MTILPCVNNASLFPFVEASVKLLFSCESKERKAPPSEAENRWTSVSPVLIFPSQSVQYIQGASHRVVVRLNGRFRLKSHSLARRTKGSLPAEESRATDT